MLINLFRLSGLGALGVGGRGSSSSHIRGNSREPKVAALEHCLRTKFRRRDSTARRRPLLVHAVYLCRRVY